MKLNERGFTLIEMLIVLLIISVLLLITIPNVIKHNSVVDEKGCDAYIELVQSQVQMYKLDHNEYPESISNLSEEGYIKNTSCPDNRELTLNNEGLVEVGS
ncbi:competence type IV pilus major pilin ComGC [Halalkalibacillus halophilus]|uniref:competence type IV pilus major pilin ComGC n=1 Tax=Halalkalibacillus halophilus TaxID=392827 RepID=UPI00040579B1|nr:competence type IV pilus major pilin ComGC [Halalkalibacillus halophilus]